MGDLIYSRERHSFSFKKRTNNLPCQKYKLEPTVRTRPVNKRILYEFPISPYKLNGDVKGRQRHWTDSKRSMKDGPKKLSIEKTQLKFELGKYAVCCSVPRSCV